MPLIFFATWICTLLSTLVLSSPVTTTTSTIESNDGFKTMEQQFVFDIFNLLQKITQYASNNQKETFSRHRRSEEKEKGFHCPCRHKICALGNECLYKLRKRRL